VTDQRQWTRRLAWEACLNARDLGGYPTASGRTTRWGAVVRSDSPAKLTPAGRAAVVAYGVRTVVDLRLPDELAQEPSPFSTRDGHGIAYVHASFMPVEREPAPPPVTLAADYARMLGISTAGVAASMTAIARAGEGGVLIHCAGGRDRTGLISAFLLDLAGVPEETIASDYALSDECLRPETENWLEHGPGERADRVRDVELFRTRPAVMRETLAYLAATHGGVEAYLLAAGVSPQDLARLRALLLG